MKTLLTTLYRNDISSVIPQRSKDEEIQNLLDLIHRHENKLKHDLPRELLDVFEKYGDCCSELHSLTDEKTFICGVRLGIQLMLEAMSDD